MTSMKTLALCTGLVLAASSTAMAQRWGRDRSPRDGVCFYQDVDFRGDYFCIRAGQDFRALPLGMNDRISSLRVFGRADVTVFSNDRFGGRSARFDGDVRDLRLDIWNDRISSVRVRNGSGRGDWGRDGGRGDGRDGRGDGRGDWGRGDGRGGRRDDPDASIRRAYQDILGREPDTAGLRLYRSRMIDDGWSEAQVREALRSSRENRQQDTMTRARAEDMVRNAYRSVLGREPDPASRSYVDRVLRDHWSQQDLERELRNSAEYRNRGR